MTSPTDLLRLALAAAQTNDRPKTLELLQEVTRTDPRNEAAWRWLADLTDSPTEAVAALERVVVINPNNDKAKATLRKTRLEAGIAAARAKDIPTARRLLRSAVADDPHAELGWFWLAAVCDSPSEAISHLQRVLALNPGNAAARKGIEYYQGKLQRAGTTSPISTSGIIRAADSERRPDPSSNTPRPGIGSSGGLGLSGGPPRTLLVVDESRTTRKLIAMAAAGDGMKVSEAIDAADAASRILEDGPPDLVLVDAALPGTDGYELCKLIRTNAATRQVPIVLMSAKEGSRDQLRGTVAGFTATVAKPIDPDALMQTVRSCLAVEPVPTA
ncbi:MAG TPA: response regulator [Fimbriiglobus sp.]|nr:response regulator [Fimbriiglobus sp.]